MNYIATVNTPAHGTISVTYSDIEKNILGAWREEETIQLSGKEKQQIANDIICNRRFTRVSSKKLMSPPQDSGCLSSRFEAGGSVSPNSSSSQHRLLCGSKQSQSSTLQTRKQPRRVCGSPTMLLRAKTSFTKPVSTRGRSLAGSS